MQTVVRLLPMFVSGLACNVFVGFMASHVPVIYLVGSFATPFAFPCPLMNLTCFSHSHWITCNNDSLPFIRGNQPSDYILGVRFYRIHHLSHGRRLRFLCWDAFHCTCSASTRAECRRCFVQYHDAGTQELYVVNRTRTLLILSFLDICQLGTAVGVTVTTVVYNNVGERLAPGEDVIAMYRAAQWTAFAFGVIGA
jgi:hypothetical protein